MFLANSRRARSLTPCLSLRECEDLAVEVLRKNRRPSSFPAMRDIASSNGRIDPGQNSQALVSAVPYRIPALTRAQKAQLRQQQLLAAPPAIPVPPAKPNALKVAGGLQVCPAFSRGAVCPRNGDGKGKCAASSGTSLHHICSICASSSHGKDNHK